MAVAAWCALVARAGLAAEDPAPPTETRLATLDLSGMTTGWGKPTADADVGGSLPLSVGGVNHERGIGTHANSAWKLNLDGKGVEFRASVGVQDAGPGRVEFIVRGDGKDLFRSGPVKGGEPAREVRVGLDGVRTLELVVDSLGDANSDHANWLEPVIVHTGAPLPPVARNQADEPLLPDLPGEPPNAAATADWNPAAGTLTLTYDGGLLFSGSVTATGSVTFQEEHRRRRQAVTQELVLRGAGLRLTGRVAGSVEAIAAETHGAAQKKFPLIRTTIGGPSRSLRNNAVYDRTRDWMLEAPATGGARVGPAATAPATGRAFTLETAGDAIRLVFRPRYYQRHKNIAHFTPWAYRVRTDSITGWCSWWAFKRDCSQKDCDELLAVWKEKKLADYGYRFIQLDDCFQNEFGRGQERKAYPGAAQTGYVARGPATWLDWRADNYPAGKEGYVTACRNAGFEPAIWIGTYFTDDELITAHPDWFIRGKDGRPFVARWSSCGVDATNREALDALVRPTFRGIRQAGFAYVKVDLLRHYLYDNLHNNLDFCRARGVTADGMYRAYLGAVREELGPETFLLSCWGVLPESVGLADGCRIGGDGYGPMTMQQYNSWNGIVWRNDPDHCDVSPHAKPAETGNVTRTTAVEAAPADTVIRPALASIAGCMLILSDRPRVYRDDANLHGLRRAAPVLFSVPGQLYDFTPDRTNNLIGVPRTSITSGGGESPIDARQFGVVNPWWLNEYDLPCGAWVVLNRINWGDTAAEKTAVPLADIGLDPAKDYVAYEFWSRRYLGVCSGTVACDGLSARGIASIALREKLPHPQIVSTNRHLSHGAADLVAVTWHDRPAGDSGAERGGPGTRRHPQHTLTGTSTVVGGDRYELAIRVPAGFVLESAAFADQPAETVTEGELVRAAFTPAATGEVAWTIGFATAPNGP